MKILKLLDNSSVVYSYEIKDFKTFSDGFYIKIEAVLKTKPFCLSGSILIIMKENTLTTGRIQTEI